MNNKLQATIADFAPKLATVLGALSPIFPFAGPAGLVVGLLAKTFGGSTPDEISSNIGQNPDAAVKLAELEEQHGDLVLTNHLLTIQATNAHSEIINQQNIGAKQNLQNWLSDNWQKRMILVACLYSVVLFTVVLLACMFFNIQLTTQEMTLISLTGGPALSGIRELFNLFKPK